MIDPKSYEPFLDQAYDHKSVEETHALYEKWAASYDLELADKGYRQPVRCAAALKALMPQGGSILDVGCGTGLSGAALHHAGYETIDGCDFSSAMLDKAKDTGVYGRLFEADLNKPPLDVSDAEYDALVAVGVFSMQHVEADAMEELIRVVKPGGPIIIGLNDKFYRLGTLRAKLDALSALGRLSQLSHDHGEHIPEIGLTGWVISLKRAI
ncbi:MAG: class I SAM-dependent methyltransferase [Pseudomonadota bacterium]